MERRDGMNRAQVFERLEELGAAKAVVEFSGGNDEGGADSITLHDAGGNEIGEVREYVPPYVVGADGGWLKEEVEGYGGRKCLRPVVREHTPEEEAEMALAAALAAPVYERFHSFAGDFSASGEVVWDVAARTATMSGSESVYEPFEEEF